MKCYASIDRIEGNFAVCEVELYFLKREQLGHDTTDTVMVDIPLQDIPTEIGEVDDGDILLVEYDGQNVTHVYCKDEQEKAKRLKLLKLLMGC